MIFLFFFCNLDELTFLRGDLSKSWIYQKDWVICSNMATHSFQWSFQKLFQASPFLALQSTYLSPSLVDPTDFLMTPHTHEWQRNILLIQLVNTLFSSFFDQMAPILMIQMYVGVFAMLWKCFIVLTLLFVMMYGKNRFWASGHHTITISYCMSKSPHSCSWAGVNLTSPPLKPSTSTVIHRVSKVAGFTKLSET